MIDRPSARPDYALGYVYASEGDRLDYERRYFPGPVTEWWQHVQSYQPWGAEEARHYAATARNCMFSHGHSGARQMSCGACALDGYEPPGGWGDDWLVSRDGPNYAGWARVYVETGRLIPATWRDAFAAQGRADNRAYYDALGRSLVTFGVRFGA